MILPLMLAGSLIAGCDREKQADGQAAAPQANISSGEARDVGAFKHIVDRANAGKAAPAVSFTGPDDAPVTLASFRGKPLLVNLWATWCAPCVKELPLLDDLAGEYDERLHVIAVSQDMQGAEKVVPFFAQHKYEYLEPWMDPENALGFALGGGQLPVTVLYDASGQEVWRVTGDYDWSSEEARAAIDEVVKE